MKEIFGSSLDVIDLYNQTDFNRLPSDAQNDLVRCALRDEIYDSADLWLEDVDINGLFQLYLSKEINADELVESIHYRLNNSLCNKISDELEYAEFKRGSSFRESMLSDQAKSVHLNTVKAANNPYDVQPLLDGLKLIK